MLWCKQQRDCLSVANDQDGMRQNETKTKINKRRSLQKISLMTIIEQQMIGGQISHLKTHPILKCKLGNCTLERDVFLFGLDQSFLQIKTKIVSCRTADSKPVKQEVNGTVILPLLVFPALGNQGIESETFLTQNFKNVQYCPQSLHDKTMGQLYRTFCNNFTHSI